MTVNNLEKQASTNQVLTPVDTQDNKNTSLIYDELVDTVGDEPVSREISEEAFLKLTLDHKLAHKKEDNKARQLIFQTGIFASSVVALISLSYISLDKPDSVRSFVKDIIPIVIGPQVTLLGTAFGGYMWVTRDKAKKDD
ncbi:MAG: hypothetical protein EAZ76_10285 [Nostocales cyanobacterium]|nr:MAG: hypothetical protein EAZ87_12060 [Nostocales cyanobacterium]TAF14062.1 MAG: hypothetical protein EAZ76_10285 [Nostocales cyanobacterium]